MKSLKLNMKSLRSDLVSGFVIGLLSNPEAMAFAKLAGVNPALRSVFRDDFDDCGLADDRVYIDDQHLDQRHRPCNGLFFWEPGCR